MTNPNPLEERGEVERALWRPFLLLALPIMLAGGLAMWLGSRDLRQSTDPGGWVPLGVGAIFELIGVAMTVALIVARHKLRRGDFDAPEGKNGPVQPWQLREDWARGEVQGENRSGFVSALVAAIFGSLVAGTAVLASWPPKDPRQWTDWLFLLFPLAALYLVARAMVLGRRWLKYGDSVLHLRVIPLTPGGALEGVIEVPRRLHPRDGFTLRLLCVNQITSGSGKHRHTREEKLWQVEQAVAADRLETAPRRLKIPVAFRLATDAPPSRKAGQAEVLWRLEARARIPGLDYATDFVLPVFAAKPVTR